MEKWHVLTENGWVKVESEDQPEEGSLVHAEKKSCLDWPCGWELN